MLSNAIRPYKEFEIYCRIGDSHRVHVCSEHCGLRVGLVLWDVVG